MPVVFREPIIHLAEEILIFRSVCVDICLPRGLESLECKASFEKLCLKRSCVVGLIAKKLKLCLIPFERNKCRSSAKSV